MALQTVTIANSATSRFYKLCATFLNVNAQRNQSTYRRTRRRLNIKPDPAFLPSKTEPHDHIIHNPPPSMPNVYHTPTIFLPQDDKRRLLQKNILQLTSGASQQSTDLKSQDLSPPVRQPYTKKYHLNEEDVKEMRRLRLEDPDLWSSNKLAKKFDCSVLFVSIATDGIAKQKQLQQELVTEVVKSRWGPKRRLAREDRAIRKETWYR